METNREILGDNMVRLLLTVEDVVVVKDKGLALVPGIVFQANETFRAGDPISLKRPDGSTIEWQIEGLTPLSQKGVCFVVRGLKKRDVPIGTEVWSVHSQLQEPLPKPSPFPRRIIVRVNDPREGLAVSLRFGMARKNDYFYTALLGPEGLAEVSGEELLRHFDQTFAFFIMDYLNPRGAFTGRVTASVPSTRELRDGIKGFEMYRDYFSFPEGYEKNLKKAAARGQNPEEFQN